MEKIHVASLMIKITGDLYSCNTFGISLCSTDVVSSIGDRSEGTVKKYKTITILAFIVFVFGGSNLFAHGKKSELPDNYITFSFVINPASVGYKHRVANSTYLTTNLDYVDDRNDITFQVGAGYMIPRKFLFFWLYGGAGLQFSRNRAYEHPYITLGTRFWILYWEAVYPMQRGEDTGFRFGFSVTF
jgi:hypothetical protein